MSESFDASWLALREPFDATEEPPQRLAVAAHAGQGQAHQQA